MREIIFRGKRTENGEWVTGSYLYCENEAYICIKSKAQHDEKFHIGPLFSVDPSTVGQYTGLTDRNGNRIFEGDILKIALKMDGLGMYYAPAIEYPANVIVKWDMCAWMWEVIGQEKYYISFPNAWCHYEFEVIGNIHDNPELLEEGACGSKA